MDHLFRGSHGDSNFVISLRNKRSA